MSEHANQVNALLVAAAVALMMVIAGRAKKQIVWRPRDRRVRNRLSIRGLRRRRWK
jgi:hypothetical protein